MGCLQVALAAISFIYPAWESVNMLSVENLLFAAGKGPVSCVHEFLHDAVKGKKELMLNGLNHPTAVSCKAIRLYYYKYVPK